MCRTCHFFLTNCGSDIKQSSPQWLLLLLSEMVNITKNLDRTRSFDIFPCFKVTRISWTDSYQICRRSKYTYLIIIIIIMYPRAFINYVSIKYIYLMAVYIHQNYYAHYWRFFFFFCWSECIPIYILFIVVSFFFFFLMPGNWLKLRS